MTGTEKPYEPLVVLVMQPAVEVGMLGEVVMHAPVTGAPAESRTVPAIVTTGFALELGAGVCGGSVRTGVGATVRTGVGDG